MADVNSIKEDILHCVTEWRKKKRGPFSWPDDALVTKRYSYNIHTRWVSAWNTSGRIKDADVFLEEWATDENITSALRVCKEAMREGSICR